MPIFLNALALQYYRGIGAEWVVMPNFKTFNFFIGPNNAGKSTVLNFISKHLPMPAPRGGSAAAPIDPLELNHDAEGNPIAVKIGQQSSVVENAVFQAARTANLQIMNTKDSLKAVIDHLAGAEGIIWLTAKLPYGSDITLAKDYDASSLKNLLHPSEWSRLWTSLTGSGSGGIDQHWIPETLNKILHGVEYKLPATRLIPAIRQIGPSGVTSDDYSGSGLIEKLMQIQSPDVSHRQDRALFDKINKFLQSVTDNPTAVIEIPHTKAHVLVNIDGRVLPLSNLGTGIHEVIMIAAFCTMSENEIVCIEEPELHLHPLLQRKLIGYLQRETSNQYFIATHSASFIDTPGSAIFHVRNDNKQTRITEAVLRKERHAICTDLGHRASDIVQSNSVIWVEGPSDRIYLVHWIRALDDSLLEGVHYSIMFYGGRLLSHLNASDEEVTEFIGLKSLNRNLAIMIDSDRKGPRSAINATKLRIQKELNDGGSIAWVTKGREVENYIAHDVLQVSVAAVSPDYGKSLEGGQFDHALHYERASLKRTRTKPVAASLREEAVDKVKVAKHVVAGNAANLDILDLKSRVTELVTMIQKANA